MVKPVTEFMLEAPAGLIGIRAECHNGKVTQVTFKNVPAFAEYLDAEIDVPHLGKVKVDVAWGGMYYVIADVRQFKGLELKPEMGREITRVSSLILRAAQDQLPVHHPDYPDVGITISQLCKWCCGLRQSFDLDWRTGSLPLRYRNVCQDGYALC